MRRILKDTLRRKEPFRFRQRNFDPETRTLRKHNAAEEQEDTVENQVKGLAEKIIAEDEERRNQELVSNDVSFGVNLSILTYLCRL